jgi:hypothetical protein
VICWQRLPKLDVKLTEKVMFDKSEIPDYFHTPNRADAQSDLLDAIIWWVERYRDADESFEENKGKARQAFYERFNIEVLQALKGDTQSMVELKDKVRADV